MAARGTTGRAPGFETYRQLLCDRRTTHMKTSRIGIPLTLLALLLAACNSSTAPRFPQDEKDDENDEEDPSTGWIAPPPVYFV
jgi:hypothetical protein